MSIAGILCMIAEVTSELSSLRKDWNWRCVLGPDLLLA
jgi:hypothetical protein